MNSQALAVRNDQPAASMLSPPDWLASRLNAVLPREEWEMVGGEIVREMIAGQMVSRMVGGQMVPTIPKSSILTPSERRAVEERCRSLDDMQRPGPDDESLTAIGALLAFYATGKSTEAQMAIKSASYLEAVEDLPAWAIERARREWFRGKCGVDQNYDFAPSPATLRRIAEYWMKVAAGHAIVLRRLLSAVPKEEIPLEQRLRNAERMRAVIEELEAARKARDAEEREKRRMVKEHARQAIAQAAKELREAAKNVP